MVRAALQSALTIDPNHADSLKLLGDLNFQHGSKANAGMAYLKILQSDPDNTDVLMRLGSCLYEGNEFESAKDCYEKVLIKYSILTISRGPGVNPAGE